jgi:CheY-like chemotaxis protein
MSRTVVCPNCQSPQAVSEPEASPEQNQGQGEIRCAQCGYPFTVGPEAAAPQAAKILWIDDDRLLLSFGREVLERHGYRILTAANGPSGIAVAKTERPDLIIVDVILPRMDGYEVCRRLRAEPGLEDTPIVLLTALENPQGGLPGGGVGATFMMTKPSRPERIIGIIESILSRKPDLPRL